MKRINYIILTLLLVSGITSCKKDFLDLQPLDKYSDEAVWKDPALVQTFVNNIYLGIPYPFSTLIRKRAGMPAINDAGSALIDRYRNERRIELAYEEQRFFDVRRWMIAPDAYATAKGVSVTADVAANGTISNRVYTVINAQTRAWNPRFYLFPIKLDEMNRNKQLVQNPLY